MRECTLFAYIGGILQSWSTFFGSYTGSWGIFNCPNHKTEPSPQHSYWYNRYLSWNRMVGAEVGVKETQIISPTQLVLFGDMGYDGRQGNWPISGGLLQNANFDFCTAEQHNGGENLLFVDGHVRWYKDLKTIAGGLEVIGASYKITTQPETKP